MGAEMKDPLMKIGIETPRLMLRHPKPEDAAEVHRAMTEVWNDLQLWMSWAVAGEETIEATRRYLAGVPEAIEKGNCPLFGFCRVTEKFVVATGIRAPAGDGGHETGYWVARDFLGRGYATEATNAAIRYAFNVMGAKAIDIHYYEDNERSRRVIEKLGFTKAGIRPKAHARCLDGMPMDIHDYVMTDPSVLPPLDVKWGPP
jgi:RimJ/RimL family protein N-acetyltransferase